MKKEHEMIFYLEFDGTIYDTDSLLKVLPHGYLLGKLIDKTYYHISFNGVGRENPVVGQCQVDPSTGQLLVVLYTNGQYSMNFLNDIVSKHGVVTLYDPATLAKKLKEDLLWLVVVPSYESKFTYYGQPTTSKEEALGVVGANVWREGACLIGFSSKAWDAGVNWVDYRTRFKLLPSKDGLVPNMENLGSGTIHFTTLESG